jgi:hypothetical protein
MLAALLKKTAKGKLADAPFRVFGQTAGSDDPQASAHPLMELLLV